jgi:WD40 repeat protein
MVAATALVVVATTIAFVRITRARDRAELSRARTEAALGVADRERADAVFAQAELLRLTDPSRAWEVLQRHHLAAVHPVLAARIESAGVATATIYDAPASVADLVTSADGRLYALARFDGAVVVVDTVTGALVDLDDRVPLPMIADSYGDRIAYVRKGDRHFELVVRHGFDAPSSIVRLDAVPFGIALNDTGVYWVFGDGELWGQEFLAQVPSRIAGGIRELVGYKSLLLVCTQDDQLVVVPPRELQRFPVRTCATRDRPRVAGDFAAIPEAGGGIALLENEKLIERVPVSLAQVGPRHRIGPSGSQIFIADSGNAVVRARNGEVHPVHLPGTPTAMEIGSSVAVWGFADGWIMLADTRTGETWSMHAHEGPIEHVSIGGLDRAVVTFSNGVLRAWKVDPSAAKTIVTATDAVSTIAASPDGRLLFDSRSGHVSMLSNGNVAQLHHHGSAAYGVAWCGAAACSSGNDGALLCTDLESRRTAVEYRAAAGIIALRSLHDDCLYVDGAGDIGSVRGHHVVRTMPFVPTAATVSPDGGAVAATTDRGDLFIADLDDEHSGNLVSAHDGPLVGLSWLDRGLLASVGYDGHVRFWTKSGHRLRDVDLGEIPWVADARAELVAVVTATGQLILVGVDGATRLQLALGLQPTAVRLSPGGKTIAVATMEGEVLLIDADTRDVVSVVVSREGTSCLQFLSDSALYVCGRDGAVREVTTK